MVTSKFKYFKNLSPPVTSFGPLRPKTISKWFKFTKFGDADTELDYRVSHCFVRVPPKSQIPLTKRFLKSSPNCRFCEKVANTFLKKFTEVLVFEKVKK